MGTQRKRGPNFGEVENALIHGEKAGLARYGRYRVDKKDLRIIDHYAYYLFAVKATNEGSADGMFFGKGLSDKEKNERCWWLQLRLIYDLVPSRLKNFKRWQINVNKLIIGGKEENFVSDHISLESSLQLWPYFTIKACWYERLPGRQPFWRSFIRGQPHSWLQR